VSYTLRTATTLNPNNPAEVDALTGTVPGTGSGNGISFLNNGRIIAVIVNTNGTALTVTQVIGKTIAGVTPTAPTTEVALTSGISVLGPYPPGTWNDADGLMKLDFSATTGAKVILLEVPTVS